jgi:hypothetical protein
MIQILAALKLMQFISDLLIAIEAHKPTLLHFSVPLIGTALNIDVSTENTTHEITHNGLPGVSDIFKIITDALEHKPYESLWHDSVTDYQIYIKVALA